MTTFVITAAAIALTLGLIAYVTDRPASSENNSRPPLTLLPGDLKYESPTGNFRFYFPVTTSIVLSLVLTLVLWLIS